MDKHQYFVSGIGTGCGKTLVSAILCKKLQATYWKPLQCGQIDNTDTDFVRRTTNTDCLPEKFVLNTPASPHYAADVDGVNINLKDFKLPVFNKPFIVEGAGGLLVPLNEKDTMLDLALHLQLPILLVINFYLGSINHTLLSLEMLSAKKVQNVRMIFNGDITPSSADIIKEKSPYPLLVQIPFCKKPNTAFVKRMAENIDFIPKLNKCGI